tara:strand:- start:46002 stop:46526 length:525 start_codon:yes stop_codon:yes gene_type:complete
VDYSKSAYPGKINRRALIYNARKDYIFLIIKMLFNYKKYFLTIAISIVYALGNSQKYGDDQIIKLLDQHFSISKNLIYFGNSIYKKDNDRILQLEIESTKKNIQTNIISCFEIMTKIGWHANTSLEQVIIIMHVEDYDLPIIANSKFQCNKKFFVDRYISEEEWRSDCLVITYL